MMIIIQISIIFTYIYIIYIIYILDGGGMDGMMILHNPQGSVDSTDSSSIPPTYSRLPPDGHEFPEGETKIFRIQSSFYLYIYNIIIEI